MPQFFSNKRLIILLVSIIILVALIGFSMKKRESLTLPEQFLKDSAGLTQTIFYKPANTLAGFFENLAEMKQLYKENQMLKARLDEYAKLYVQYEEVKKTNETLKAQLDKEEDLTDFKVREGTVIGRSPDQWNQFIYINKGEKDGIKPKMAVISPQGFIGKVTNVSLFQSTVQLISDNDRTNRFSAIVQGEKNIFGTIEGYDAKKQALVFKKIPVDAKIKKGQKVITSGLGDVFPPNLLIGEVIDIEPDEVGLTQTAYLKPSADLYDIDHVMVLEREMPAVDESLREKEEE
ncbi:MULTISPECIES: rod shape-determining protein MreC [Fictibacillus]|uniref:rod shape-determining protein MreC n=1 Tax=Fictibacillus TaxID=1329200 RepID=UPI0018CFC87F|nr:MULTISPECIES: rod shape-determining protein MreC [unclassified Fictibacillus]MBH0159932.1 rod shape-determining protein MreC [Fictibacillus sp. 26RED30]MBH0163316.1 rod shape-determining protein MreC [Fictibacillus sp. 7GRE50]